MITRDNDGKIALLHAKKWNYYKLPGGGIESGEDKNAALERELREEIGCRAENDGGVGVIEEFRNDYKLHQFSYCYHGRIVGEKCAPNFTDSEKSEKFAIVWADNLEQAIQLVENSKSEFYDAKFMRLRDLTFLKEFKKTVEISESAA